MIIACLAIAHASQRPTDAAVEIKIHNMRASKALQILSTTNSKTVTQRSMEASDERGVIIVHGSPESVQQVREIARLIDVPRKRISVKVTVDSEADKASYLVTARLWSMQKWTTSDSDLGVKVAIQPRLTEDNTVTMLLVCSRAGGNSIEESFRMKLGSKRSINLGNHITSVYKQGPDGQFSNKTTSDPGPKITIEVDR